MHKEADIYETKTSWHCIPWGPEEKVHISCLLQVLVGLLYKEEGKGWLRIVNSEHTIKYSPFTNFLYTCHVIKCPGYENYAS